MDLSHGLTQTTLVSVINLFTMKIVLRTRIFQLHLTNLSIMDELIREVKVIIKWLLSKHGIRREIHLTSWSSPQVCLYARSWSSSPHILVSWGILSMTWLPLHADNYKLFRSSQSFCWTPNSFIQLPIQFPLGCSPSMFPKQNCYFPSPKLCPSPAVPCHLMSIPISHLLRTKS